MSGRKNSLKKSPKKRKPEIKKDTTEKPDIAKLYKESYGYKVRV